MSALLDRVGRVDFSEPAVDVHDELVEIYTTLYPHADPDDVEEWAEQLIAERLI